MPPSSNDPQPKSLRVDPPADPRTLLEHQEETILRELRRGNCPRARTMLDLVREIWFAHNYAERWLELDQETEVAHTDEWATDEILRAEG